MTLRSYLALPSMHCFPRRSLPPHIRVSKPTVKPEWHVSNAFRTALATSHIQHGHDVDTGSFTNSSLGTEKCSPRSWATVSVCHVRPTFSPRTAGRLWSDEVRCFRLYSTLSVATPRELSPTWEDDPETRNKAMLRKRRVEWKRRQGVRSFPHPF